MSHLARLVRGSRAAELRAHLDLLDVHYPADVDWGEGSDRIVPFVLRLAGDLPDELRERLTADAERICSMSDEVGQAAMLSLPDWREHLDAIEGAHIRAHWLYLQSRQAFRQAEEIRFADESQNAERLWDAFVGPRLAQLSTDPAALSQFEEHLRFELQARRLHVERYNRTRRTGDRVTEVHQITVYNEDLPEDEAVFSPEGALQTRTRRPVRETAIVYEPASGTIEVVGKQKAVRAHIAETFATILLNAEFKGDRLPPRRIDLSPLMDGQPLTVHPGDGIEKVKLVMLTLSSETRLKQRFEIGFDEDLELHDALDEQFGEASPLRSTFPPWMAQIVVKFEPSAGSRRGKKIRISLCAPNKCSLRGRTEQERLLLGRYLRSWGIDRSDATLEA